MTDHQTQDVFDQSALSLQSDEFLYEAVVGQIVEIQSVGTGEVWCADPPANLYADRLANSLRRAVESQSLGRVLQAASFAGDNTGPPQRPAAAYVSFQRWPVDRTPPEQAWPIAPDLAVEVVSPVDSFETILARVAAHFSGGTKRIWVIAPTNGLVYCYDSVEQARILPRGGSLMDEELLPGFRLPLDELFASENTPS